MSKFKCGYCEKRYTYHGPWVRHVKRCSMNLVNKSPVESYKATLLKELNKWKAKELGDAFYGGEKYVAYNQFLELINKTN